MSTFIINVVLASMVVAYFAFIAVYTVRFPWRSTWQGKILVAQKTTLAMLAVFFLVDSLVERWAARDVVLIFLLTALAVEAWATLAALIGVLRRVRNGTSRPSDPTSRE